MRGQVCAYSGSSLRWKYYDNSQSWSEVSGFTLVIADNWTNRILDGNGLLESDRRAASGGAGNGSD
jgi:hypothetical protein